MRKMFVVLATLLFTAVLASPANASTFNFTFTGPGVSGNITLTYGLATDSTYADAIEVTGISGTFSDSNNGLNLVDVPILSLVPLNHAAPEATNLLAPNDFSKFIVPTLLHGSLSYDNLYWPNGSPQTASDYPFGGGFLDIYGLLFDIGNNEVVNLWSNGSPDGSGNGPIYGVAVATADTGLDYVDSGVSVPEPSSLLMLGFGIAGLAGTLRRRSINR